MYRSLEARVDPIGCECHVELTNGAPGPEFMKLYHP